MKKQKVLVVGSGGREHAIGWKINQSPNCGQVFFAPGNGGTSEIGTNVPIKAANITELLSFARQEQIDLTVVGPEDPLALGIVDLFQEAGLRIFGPTREAASIESDKIFARALMDKAGIAGPKWEFFGWTNLLKAEGAINRFGGRCVIKDSGLAAGKGVKICFTRESAYAELEKMFQVQGRFVTIEELLEGPEYSIQAVCDGETAILYPASMDHKRVGEDDTGPNTGGMGAIAPIPWRYLEGLQDVGQQALNAVIHPLLKALKEDRRPFQGIIYPGMMLTKEGPKVLEVNARGGDPETQPLMMLMRSDLLELMNAAVDGTLAEQPKMEWHPGFAASVVLASEGYPDEYKIGEPISIEPRLLLRDDLSIFHAGTKREDGRLFTNGGRVLSVTARGNSLRDALESAYEAADQIYFKGKYLRRDIGQKVLRRMAELKKH